MRETPQGPKRVDEESMTGRAVMTAAGGLTGLGLYAIIDMGEGGALSIAGFVALGVLGWAFMVGIGPLSFKRAAQIAASMAVVVGLLVLWSMARFDLPGRPPWPALFATTIPAVMIAMAFAIVLATPRFGDNIRQRFGAYAALFDTAWAIFLRQVAALCFVGVFWAFYFLSNALLELVGLSILEDFADIEPVPWVLTGAMAGVFMHISYLFTQGASPELHLRLLRVFVLPFLIVVGLFVGLAVVSGLAPVFSNTSLGGTMMAVAIAQVTLVTAAIGALAGDEVDGRVQSTAVALLALLALPVGCIALASVWLRVGDYGWTPERVFAALGAFVTAAYGVSYAGAIVVSMLRKRDWPAAVRRANIYLSLMIVVLAGLFLTPVLDAQRIASADQFARIMAGKTDVYDWPLRELSRDWGKAGEARIAALEAASEAGHWDAETREILADRLVNTTRTPVQKTPTEVAEILAAHLWVYPEKKLYPAKTYGDQSDWILTEMAQACELLDAQGAPMCFAVDFAENGDPKDFIYFYTRKNTGQVVQQHRAEGGKVFDAGELPSDLFHAVFSGELTLGPVMVQGVSVRGQNLYVAK